ncbi:MAG: hypothetical protein IJ111_06895 [Eggerthellaceae bacterium]|nr:hypothetical protein [Eggerthellaceae bacterium]
MSYSAHTPSGSIFLPSSSKQTVTILYVGIASEGAALPTSILEGEEREGEAPFSDGESGPAIPWGEPAASRSIEYGEEEPCEGEGWEGEAGEEKPGEHEAMEDSEPSPLPSKCICS